MMGGGYVASHAVRAMVSDLKESINVLKRLVSISHGRLRSGDVPVLIRALSIATGGVDRQAREALTALAGRDLGREPGPWLDWWRQRGCEVLARQAEEAAAAELFGRLREDVVTGRWGEVRSLLSERMRAGAAAEELARIMAGSAGALRRAYRDSSVSAVRLEGGRGTLVVDWGAEGFEFGELALVREPDGWKLDACPWGSRLVTMPAREVRTNRLVRFRPRGRPSVFASRCSLKALLVMLAAVVVTAGLYCMWRYLDQLGDNIPEWLHAPLAVAIGGPLLLYFPASFIYYAYIRPLPNSRQLRAEFPDCRPLRACDSGSGEPSDAPDFRLRRRRRAARARHRG